MKKLAQMCFCKREEENEWQIGMETILKKLNKLLRYERSEVFVLLVRIYTRHLERKDYREACFMIRELGRICHVENIDRYVSTILARDMLERNIMGDQPVTVVKEEETTPVENFRDCLERDIPDDEPVTNGQRDSRPVKTTGRQC